MGSVCWGRDIRVGEVEVREDADTGSMGLIHSQLGVKAYWIQASVAEHCRDEVRCERLSIRRPSTRIGHRPTRHLCLPSQHPRSPPQRLKFALVDCRKLE